MKNEGKIGPKERQTDRQTERKGDEGERKKRGGGGDVPFLTPFFPSFASLVLHNFLLPSLIPSFPSFIPFLI
jgi:hypothetical protein